MQNRALSYIEQTIEEIESKPEISIKNQIKSGDYYGTKERCRVLEISQKGQEKILKIYDDPRTNYEFENTQVLPTLLDTNLISMPHVFEGTSDNTPQARRGWYIMEKLDLNNFHGNFSDFLTLFKEYKNSFSQKAPIHLPKPKNSAVEFHLQRIQNWLNLNKYFGSHNQTPPESIFNELNSIFDTCVPYIEHSFENEPFHLGHNHFSYSELHSTPQNKSPYTLTDFGHLGWKPESYELAFIIWHEFLLSKLKNKEFQSVTQSTMEGIEESFKVGLYEKSKHTIYAALLERALGTLFADVWSSNPSESIEIKLAKHNAVKLLIEELLNQLGH